jgi:hypothetical protein
MLIYGLYALILLLAVVAVWFAWHLATRGRKPPEAEPGDKGPPPSDRDEEWDPRERYQDEAPPAADPHHGKAGR